MRLIVESAAIIFNISSHSTTPSALLLLTTIKLAKNICTAENNFLPLHRKTEMTPFKANRFAKIAQLVEHNLAKVGVAGSSPVFRSKRTLKILVCRVFALAKIAQLVEHNLAKVGVAGSSPVFRSIKPSTEILTDTMSGWWNW